MSRFVLPTISALILPLALGLVSCTGNDKATDKSGDSSAADADTDTDTDADTDADADTDSAQDTDPHDMSSYVEFSIAQATMYCDLLETCGYLDENGYADVAACKADVTAHLSANDCAAYDQAAAMSCIDAERHAALDCSTYTGGVLPPCMNVCGGGTDSGAPPAGPAMPAARK